MATGVWAKFRLGKNSFSDASRAVRHCYVDNFDENFDETVVFEISSSPGRTPARPQRVAAVLARGPGRAHGRPELPVEPLAAAHRATRLLARRCCAQCRMRCFLLGALLVVQSIFDGVTRNTAAA